MLSSSIKNILHLFHTPLQNTKDLSIVNGALSSNFGKIKFNFATKKRKVIQLNTTKVDLTSLDQEPQALQTKEQIKSYLEIRKKIESIPWESMQFHKLCSLDKQLIDGLQIELKKDKFNITDQQFLANQLKNGKELPLRTYQDLDRHYKKIYTLLKNKNDFYEEFPSKEELKKGYLHEIYITDLINDKELNFVISKFIKNVAKPQKLEAITEPTFVKYLLSVKRELLLQGIHFETKGEMKQTKQKKEKIIESIEKDHMPKIKILQILNYEYEFWQDVKHNRAKNGSEENFIIETKQVPNPNQSLVLRELYPTVKIKYIARRKSLKDKEMCFCIKAELMIEIDDKHKRKIKVEWKGPSDGKMNQPNQMSKKASFKQESEEQVSKVGYMVIDYEDIYDGNPTIRPIFYF